MVTEHLSGSECTQTSASSGAQVNGIKSGIFPRKVERNTEKFTSRVSLSVLYCGFECFPSRIRVTRSFYRDTFDTGEKIVETKVIDHQQEFPYLNNPAIKYEALAIPYENTHFTLYVILPYKNQSLSALTDVFDKSQYQTLIESMYNTKAPIHLRLPRLKFKWAAGISPILKNLGIRSVFDRIIINEVVCSTQLTISFETVGAQLSMTDFFLPRTKKQHSFDKIPRQKVVSEARQFGNCANITNQPIPFYVNRPFMFLIYNHDTKTVIFYGLINDPTKITNY